VAHESEETGATPGVGHNGDVPEEALFLSHLNKLRKQAGVVAEKKAAYDAEKATMTDLFRMAKVDGFTRKELQAILDDTSAAEPGARRDLVAEEERRAKLRAWAGLPAGSQGDLFDTATPQEAKDELFYEGLGYAAGLRGDDATAPTDVPPRFVQAWLRGRMSGQEKLAWGLAEAGRVVDRKPDANAAPVELEPEPEEEFDPDAAARKLKNDPAFMDRSAPDADELDEAA
jgi:hypothetical protein